MHLPIIGDFPLFCLPEDSLMMKRHMLEKYGCFYVQLLFTLVVSCLNSHTNVLYLLIILLICFRV